VKKRAATNVLPALLALSAIALAAGLLLWAAKQPQPHVALKEAAQPQFTPTPVVEPQPEEPATPEEIPFIEETPLPTLAPAPIPSPTPEASVAPVESSTPTPAASPKKKKKPDALPKKVALKQPVAFDLILKGKNVGQITVPKGTLVDVVEMLESKLQVRHRDGIALVEPDVTDLAERSKTTRQQTKPSSEREARVIYVGRNPDISTSEDGTRTHPLGDLNMALQIAAQTLDAGSDVEIRLLSSGTHGNDFDQIQASAKSKGSGTLRMIADSATVRFRRCTLTFAVARLEIENCAFFEGETGLFFDAATPHVTLRACSFFENQRGLAVEGNVQIDAGDCAFYANTNSQLALTKVSAPAVFRLCVFQSGTTEGDLLVDSKPGAKSMRFEQCLFYSPRREVFRLNNGKIGSIRAWTETVEESGSDWSRQKSAEKIGSIGRLQ